MSFSHSFLGFNIGHPRHMVMEYLQKRQNRRNSSRNACAFKIVSSFRISIKKIRHLSLEIQIK